MSSEATKPSWDDLLALADDDTVTAPPQPSEQPSEPELKYTAEELEALRAEFIEASVEGWPRRAKHGYVSDLARDSDLRQLGLNALVAWLHGEADQPPSNLSELAGLLEWSKEPSTSFKAPTVHLLRAHLAEHGEPPQQKAERLAEEERQEAEERAERERQRLERQAAKARARAEEIADLAASASPLDVDTGYAAFDAFKEADLPSELAELLLRNALAATKRLNDQKLENLLDKVPSVNHLLRGGLAWAFLEELSSLLSDTRVQAYLRTDEYTLALWEAIHGPEGLIAQWQMSQATSTPEADEVGIEPDWIAPGFLERGDLIELSGWRKSGKSWLNLGFAVDLAKGLVPFTGEAIPGSPPKVAYIDLENKSRITNVRLDVLWEGEEQPPNFVWRHFGGLSVLEPESMYKLEIFLSLNNPDVICIGSAMNLMTATPEGGNLGDTPTAYSEMAALLKRWQAKGWAVILEHHLTSKGDSSLGTNTLDNVMTHIVKFKSGKLSMEARDPRPVWTEVGQLVREFPESAGKGGRWIPKISKPSAETSPESEAEAPRAPALEASEETPEQRRDRVAELLEAHPEKASNMSALAREVGCSRDQLNRDRTTLQEEGRWPEE